MWIMLKMISLYIISIKVYKLEKDSMSGRKRMQKG